MQLDTAKIREDFPLYARDQRANFAYLDSAASSLTPNPVINAMTEYYEQYRANVHRGLYRESAHASAKYEEARQKVARWIGANEREVIFTRGATEGLNLAAQALASELGPGDEVAVTAMEHHANFVPWQQLAKERGFKLVKIGITDSFELNMDSAKQAIGPRTKVLAFTMASNVLGTITPARELVALAKSVGAAIVIDAAQAAGHSKVNVKSLDCDFLAFSGHKMFGPTGIGVLYGKKERLEKMQPTTFGGDMISKVTWEESAWNEIPYRFEAGTPNIAGAIGLGAAIDYIESVGIEDIASHETRLAQLAIRELERLPYVKVIGPGSGQNRTGVVSFTVEGVHPHDLATILDSSEVCVRAGQHCAMPLMHDLGLKGGTTRASFSVYSDEGDADKLVAGIEKARKIFGL